MKLKLITSILIILFLTSCTQVVVDNSDEIRMNKWSAKSENGNISVLKFKNDIAEFKVKNNNKEIVYLKGLCLIDDKKLMIYNQSEQEPYFFEYKIKNNNLILKYDGKNLKFSR